MSKKFIKRIASLCTCVTLVAALPVSMDGCMDDMIGGVIGGAGGWSETSTTQTATASASGGSASASASTTTYSTAGQGFFGGGWLNNPSNNSYSYGE